ncbi:MULTISPECIES: Gp138 family membrane-puncturing spike protein [unclassified Acinetobacter]|uniref:Gp138 family membrane-puncturing spike protein n=1 Tax=unclassified Acinetobacter TaxID=196816 RepID=UPI0025BC6762|nr:MULTISPECIES: Gp138 family membrane-puncturing spike protein [unclassified Acinetobacter]
MALTVNERSPDLLGIIKDAVTAEVLSLWTSLPCEVVSYDSDAVTVEVKPLIRVPARTPDGGIEMLEIPILQDVPVMFPCAGGFTITHPINVGDECLVSFSSRNIDLWWQSGGVQNPFDTRHHDLSDGFAFFRPQSQANKISNISTDSLEIRSDDNATKIQITKDGVFNFIGQKAVFHCDVEMKKTLTVSGLIKSLTDVVAKAVSLLSHITTGVASGSGKSGPPEQ